MFAILVACWVYCVTCVGAFKAEWIQMSESASLPMSKRYRDDLRERLAKLDFDKLNDKDRQALINLKRLLEDDFPSGEDSEGYIGDKVKSFLLLVIASIGVVWFYRRRQNPTVTGLTSDDLRKARVFKYE